MKIRGLLSLGMALAASLAAVFPALAKEPVSITISGPGLAGAIEVVDPEVFRAMSDTGGTRVAETALPELGETFYEIRIGIGDESGQVFVTNVFHFYADPAGGRGYLQYFDIEGGSADGLGSWFRAPTAWETTLRGVLASHGVDLAAVPAPQVVQETVPAAQAIPAATSPSPLIGVLLAAVITIVVSALGWRSARFEPKPAESVR